MKDAPERIWAIPIRGDYPGDFRNAWIVMQPEDGAVGWVRADLHDARIAELEAEVARLRGEASELVEVAARAIRLSLDYPGEFKVHAMEPLYQAISRTRAALAQDRGK